MGVEVVVKCGELPKKTGNSKLTYALWGIALSVLLALGLVCWQLVLPLLQVRAVVRERRVARISYEAAIERLGGSEKAVGRLSFYLNCPKRLAPYRLHAVTILARCGPEAIPELARLLEDEDKEVRFWAAVGLGDLGDTRAIGPLAAALKDERVGIRWLAAHTLGQLNDEGAVEPLLKALEDEDKTVREEATKALRRLRSALPPSPIRHR